MAIINLPYSNNSFESDELIAHLRDKNTNFIIQGQKTCIRSEHTKPDSLDCWLRDNYAHNPDTMQAGNKVIAALVNTGNFEEGYFICPSSGRRCKGIKLVSKKYAFIHETCIIRSKGKFVLCRLPEQSPRITDEIVKTVKYSIDWFFNYQGDDIVMKEMYRYVAAIIILIIVLFFALVIEADENISFTQSLILSIKSLSTLYFLAFGIFMHTVIYWTYFTKLVYEHISRSCIDLKDCYIEDMIFPRHYKYMSHIVAILISYVPLILLFFTMILFS